MICLICKNEYDCNIQFYGNVCCSIECYHEFELELGGKSNGK
jgi:hypothetical protein